MREPVMNPTVIARTSVAARRLPERVTTRTASSRGPSRHLFLADSRGADGLLEDLAGASMVAAGEGLAGQSPAGLDEGRDGGGKKSEGAR